MRSPDEPRTFYDCPKPEIMTLSEVMQPEKAEESKPTLLNGNDSKEREALKPVLPRNKPTCELCCKQFTRNSNLTRHVQSVHENYRFPCSRCDKVYRRKDLLIRHSKECQRNTLENPESDLTLDPLTVSPQLIVSSEEILTIENESATTPVTSFEEAQPSSPKPMISSEELPTIEKGSATPLTSLEEPRASVRTSKLRAMSSLKETLTLDEHNSTYENDEEEDHDDQLKKGKVSKEKNALKPGLPRNKPTCDICCKHFTHNSNLTRHIRSVHKNYRFPCSRCGKVYRRKDLLIRHSKVCQTNSLKNDLKPLASAPKVVVSAENSRTIENGSATPVTSLQELSIRASKLGPLLNPRYENDDEDQKEDGDHNESINGRTSEETDVPNPVLVEANYTCELCSKSYVHDYNLIRHISTVHKKCQFNCPKCSKLFTRKDVLFRHLKSHKNTECGSNPEPPESSNGLPLDDSSTPTLTNSSREAENSSTTTPVTSSEDTCDLEKPKEENVEQAGIKSLDATNHYEKNFTCNLCCNSRKFRYEINLLHHIKMVHEQGRWKEGFPCSECQLTFKRRDVLLKHKKVHQILEDVSAPTSNNAPPSKTNDEKGYTTEEGTCTSQSVPKRRRIRRPGQHPCQVCGKVCKSKWQLEIHYRNHTGEKPFRCPECKKRFSSKGCLKNHLKLHSGKEKHPCQVCNKVFKRSGDLSKHKVIHREERRHECTICHKRYKIHQQLLDHYMTHTGEKPYECDFCHKTFPIIGMMHTHKKIHMELLKEVCEHCGKIFKKRGSLQNHIELVHTGIKSFLCEECGKGFVRRQTLQRHMLVHTGERSHVCEVCGMSFGQSCTLRRHMLLHTGEKPHVCEVCGSGFTQKTLLQGHLRHHANGLPLA